MKQVAKKAKKKAKRLYILSYDGKRCFTQRVHSMIMRTSVTVLPFFLSYRSQFQFEIKSYRSQSQLSHCSYRLLTLQLPFSRFSFSTVVYEKGTQQFTS